MLVLCMEYYDEQKMCLYSISWLSITVDRRDPILGWSGTVRGYAASACCMVFATGAQKQGEAGLLLQSLTDIDIVVCGLRMALTR